MDRLFFNTMERPVRTKEAFQAILLLLIGFFFAAAIFATTLMGAEIPLLAIIFVLILTIVPIEAGLYKKRILYMYKKQQHEAGISSQAGRGLKYIALIRAIVAVIIVSLFVVLFLGIILYTASDLKINQSTITFVLVYVCYVIIRTPMLAVLKRVFKVKTVGADEGKAGMITADLGWRGRYTLGINQVNIDLNIKQIGGPKRNMVMAIHFDEVEEMKVLKAPEVKPFLQYTIGPKADILKLKQAKEVYQFLKGKKERPSVYIGETDGFNIYIKGPEIFYLIGFKDKNPKEVVDAFNKYKGGKK